MLRRSFMPISYFDRRHGRSICRRRWRQAPTRRARLFAIDYGLSFIYLFLFLSPETSLRLPRFFRRCHAFAAVYQRSIGVGRYFTASKMPTRLCRRIGLFHSLFRGEELGFSRDIFGMPRRRFRFGERVLTPSFAAEEGRFRRLSYLQSGILAFYRSPPFHRQLYRCARCDTPGRASDTPGCQRSDDESMRFWPRMRQRSLLRGREGAPVRRRVTPRGLRGRFAKR